VPVLFEPASHNAGKDTSMTRHHSLKGMLCCGIALCLSVGPAVAAASGPATGDTSKDGVALSNSYAGNT